MYVRASIPDYWIVNLMERVLEVHREPDGTAYRSIRTYDEQQAVAPLAAPGQPIGVSSLLPRPKTE
jgi:Uma2 family endonuclease